MCAASGSEWKLNSAHIVVFPNAKEIQISYILTLYHVSYKKKNYIK